MIRWLGTTGATAAAGAKAYVLALAGAATLVVYAAAAGAADQPGAAAPVDAQAAPQPSAAPPDKPAAAEAMEPSIYDRIWGYTKLYSNSKNPWFQEFAIVGREQVDWYYFDGTHRSKDGIQRHSTADNFVNRRTRIGFKAKAFQTVTIHTEVDLNLEGDGETYGKLTDAYVKWSPEKWFNLTAGKHGAKFTLDGGTSSTQLITIDRSNIANNFWFPDEYFTGLSANGDIGKWFYNVGVFSAGDQNSEFGNFEGDAFVVTSGGYDLASLIGFDKAPIRLDYVYQNPDTDNDVGRSNEHVLSLNFQGEKGPWGLYTDIDYSNGFGSGPELVGGQIMPSFKFCETWQAVVRYTGISSSDDNGIRLARYENRIEPDRGDEYHEIYVGLNKYFYGHKLKWQTGLQYASMNDDPHDGGAYDGWGVTTGLRASW
jgi:phosphate-selective porin OprO and OprP